MVTMQIRVNRETVRSSGGIRTTVIRVLGLAIAAMIWLAADPAFAQLSSTTGLPAGDQFTANLAAGTKAKFTVSGLSVNCDTSSTSGAVPAAPANHNPSGPITGPITSPVFKNGTGLTCPATLGNATTTTSGAWSISLQFNTGGSTGTLTIPQNGVTTSTSIGGCVITVAPGGQTTVTGAFTSGSGSTKARLAISNASVPVSVTGGFGCPTGAHSATFSATYDITDTTSSPPTQIQVTN